MKGAYGERMIKKLKGMKIAVFGLRGVGIEAAKNLLLAGPHTVVVHDDETVQIEDLGANFYLESDVGKSRAEACRAELADINPNTYFRVHSGPVDTALLRGFSVVVFTDLQKQWPPRKLLELDAFCGQNDIKFIWAGVQECTCLCFPILEGIMKYLTLMAPPVDPWSLKTSSGCLRRTALLETSLAPTTLERKASRTRRPPCGCSSQIGCVFRRQETQARQLQRTP